MLWTLLAGVALAGGPSAQILDDGSIVATVSVRAPVEVARAKVSDPAWVSATDGGGTKVTVTGRDGPCLLIDQTSPSVFLEVRYATRQCPTSDGVRGTLLSSNTFTAYSTSWRVVPEGAGSRIEYRLAMKTKLAIPQSWITGTLEKRILGLMEKIATALGR